MGPPLLLSPPPAELPSPSTHIHLFLSNHHSHSPPTFMNRLSADSLSPSRISFFQ